LICKVVQASAENEIGWVTANRSASAGYGATSRNTNLMATGRKLKISALERLIW